MQQKQVEPEQATNTDSYQLKYSSDINVKTDKQKKLRFSHIGNNIFRVSLSNLFFNLLKV